ncbi:benenodin family lasso peptide [Caulobacter sp.]
MQRIEQRVDDLIDLGDASVETKGQEEGGIEPGSYRLVTGLADD